MTDPSPRRWFQIRLGTVLLLMAIAALSIAQFGSMRRSLQLEAKNQELLAKNSQLKAEIGELEVVDPTKVAALRIRDLDELTWRWKVWLPQGNWKMSVLTQGIPSLGIPGGSSISGIAGGREIPVSATIRKGPNGNWQFRAFAADARIGNDLSESHRIVAPFVQPAPLISENVVIAGDKAPESFDPSQAVVLIRLRAQEIETVPGGGWRGKDDPQSSDGVMIWLERLP